MKHFILLTIVCFLTSTLTINAQNEEYKSVVSASVGYSLTGAIINAFETTNSAADISVSSIPTLQLTYDYGITNYFSVGVAAGFQKFGFDVTDYEYINDIGINVNENFKADYSRLNIAIRPLFHYANTDKLDMYSGLRIGFVNNNISSESTNEDFDIGTSIGTRPSVGVTAYGIRYYFTDNIGAGIEINIGAPYISCLNINARF